MNEDLLLRTHTSAHQNENIRKFDRFCLLADVYRRDEIDSTHYPIFHQMEGVSLYSTSQLDFYLDQKKNGFGDLDSFVQNKEYRYFEDKSREKNLSYVACVVEDMKQTHENLIRYLLGDENVQMKWVEAYFPFTEPSYELEVFFNNQWVEMLGCGKIKRSHSQTSNIPQQ